MGKIPIIHCALYYYNSINVLNNTGIPNNKHFTLYTHYSGINAIHEA